MLLAALEQSEKQREHAEHLLGMERERAGRLEQQRENADKQRENADKQRENAEQLLVTERELARRLGFLPAACQLSTRPELLQLCSECNFPKAVYLPYFAPDDGRRQSEVYMSRGSGSSDSVATTSDRVTIKNFTLDMLDNTPSQVHLRRFLWDERVILDVLARKWFNGEVVLLESFLVREVGVLCHLRSALAFLSEVLRCRISETTQVQPIFILFLQGLVANLAEVCPGNLAGLVTVPATRTLLTAEVHMQGRLSQVTLHGFTDVISGRASSAQPDEWVSFVELKIPFGTLHKRNGAPEKTQLIAQLEVATLMRSPTSNPMTGLLTDLFSIHLVIRMPSELTHQPGGLHFVTHRVVEERAFVIRVLLSLAGLSVEEWRSLGCTVEGQDLAVESEDDPGQLNAVFGQLSTDPSSPAPRAAPVSQRRTRSSGHRENIPFAHNRVTVDISTPSQCEHEADVDLLMAWDAKRRGVSYLNADALRLHTAACR